MKPIKLNIKTKNENYPILIGTNIISKVSKLFSDNSINFKKCLLVIDKKVPKKFIYKINNSFKNKNIYKYYFDANEINKNQKNVDKILNFLLNKNFSREDCLVSVGGGITGEVSGFAW